jgi:hypothetical protein
VKVLVVDALPAFILGVRRTGRGSAKGKASIEISLETEEEQLVV